jgi:hypothetical protein
LWHNRQTEDYYVLRPKPRNHRSNFEAQITKPELPILRPKPGNPTPPVLRPNGRKPSTLVLRLNQETRASHLHMDIIFTVIFMNSTARSRRVSHAVLSPSVLWRNRQTEVCMVLRPKPRNHRTDFEAQITKPELPVLRPKPKNPMPPVLRPNRRKPSTLVLRLNQETRTSHLHVDIIFGVIFMNSQNLREPMHVLLYAYPSIKYHSEIGNG